MTTSDRLRTERLGICNMEIGVRYSGLPYFASSSAVSRLELNVSGPAAGSQIGALCRGMHRERGETMVRRIQGVLSLAKKYGAASAEEACAAALEVGVCDYRFVRRYLERHPQLPLSLRQVDPLIRQLTWYRDFIEGKTKENNE